MKITIERELDMEELFDDISYDISGCETCEDACLHPQDFTPEVLADIFSELAEVAAKRAAKAAKAKRE
jgi:predicted DNA-binding transcriptional regulator YafY